MIAAALLLLAMQASSELKQHVEAGLAAKRADPSEMAYFAEGAVELVDDIFAGCAVLAA